MYISFDNGGNWQTFQNNLPLVPITDLTIKDRHLVAATQGRAFWIIDDLSPLYEIEKVKNQDSYLFTPKPTFLLNAGYGGKSKTQGENHPNGAILSYYLSELDSTKEYKLEFNNDQGELIRSFSSKAKDSKNKWEPKKGANRFIWDMKTNGVDQIKGMILWFVVTDGPFVLPGEYTVKLHAGDDVHTVPLEILKDPRVSSSREDLQAQYDFIVEGVDKMNEINATIKEIRKVNSQLEKLKSPVVDEELKSKIVKLLEAGSNIEKALYQTKNRSPQDPLNYPIRLNNK